MIKSMTGYGQSHSLIMGFDINIEIKSLNYKYLDSILRIPEEFSFLEPEFKSLISNNILRGRLDIKLMANKLNDNKSYININENLLNYYLDLAKNISNKFNLKNDLTLSNILNIKDITYTQLNESEKPNFIKNINLLFLETLNKLDNMRIQEGQFLKTAIISILNEVELNIFKIKQIYPNSISHIQTKLRDKLIYINNGVEIDNIKLLSEIVSFTDKLLIEEELTRILSHIQQFRLILDNNPYSSVGKCMDFIVQEINREINTVAAKSQDIEISKLVINIKSNIDKIREQTQNIE